MARIVNSTPKPKQSLDDLLGGVKKYQNKILNQKRMK